MPRIYLSRWAANDIMWHAPGMDHTGVVDMRSIPQMSKKPGTPPEGYCIVMYDGVRTYPELEVDLGETFDGQLRTAQITALKATLGKPIAETRLDKVLFELFVDHADPTGQTAWKPIRVGRNRNATFAISKSVKISERAIAGHQAHDNTIAVFQSDYRRHKLAGDYPDETLRKWTGAEMLKLFKRTSDDLTGILPTEYEGDGWKRPETAVSDNFSRANESLDAGNWTETAGAWSVTSSAATMESDVTGMAEYTTDLSSDDHFTQVDIIANTSTSIFITQWNGPTARAATGAVTGYQIRADGNGKGAGNIDAMFLEKIVAGSITNLVSDGTDRSLPLTLKVDITSGDLVSGYVGGSTFGSATDTTITGNVRGGMFGRNENANTTNNIMGNWSAEDLAADVAVVRHRLSLLGVGR